MINIAGLFEPNGAVAEVREGMDPEDDALVALLEQEQELENAHSYVDGDS